MLISSPALKQPSNQYKWDNESETKFRSALTDIDIQNKLKFINNNVNSTNVTSEILLDEFTNILYQSADRSLRKKRSYRKKARRQKWFDRSCADLKTECKKLGRILQDQPNNTQIRHLLFSTKKTYKKMLKKCKNDFKITILKRLEAAHENNPSAYWKILDELKSVASEPQSDKIDPSKWFSYFKDLFSVTPPTDPIFDQKILKELEEMEQQNVFNELEFRIEKSEVEAALKHLKYGKATGLDGIMNEMLRAGADIFSKPLSVIFNKLFTNGEYPKKWGQGVITTIYKAGDHLTPSNYRGITLCSNLSKVYSMVLNERLVKYLEQNGLRAPEQIGFQRKARTSDHIFVLKLIIDKCIKPNGGRLYACFIDMKKAFDKVWWQGLFFKLQKSGIGGNFYKTVKNMYNTISSCVKTPRGLTPTFSVYQGVRQGETLSPTLFNLYLNDLPEAVAMGHTDPIQLGPRNVHCLMYADDIVLLSKTKNGLQNCLNNVHNYCAKWKLEINLMKTKVIIFNKTGRLMKDKFNYGDKVIECVKTYKYLGLEFSNTGSFNIAKYNLKVKAMKACFKLKKIIDANSLSPKIAISLFNSLIKPIALYGSKIWGVSMCAPTIPKMVANLDSLPMDKILLSFSRFILGVHKHTTSAAVRGELGLYPLGIATLKSILKYKEHILNAPDNSLLKCTVVELSSLSNDPKSWLSLVHRTEQLVVDIDKPYNHHTILQKYKSLYREFWLNLLNKTGSKLRTYAWIKSNLAFENYLTMVPIADHRKALTRLRTSSHKLAIETGRYCRPKLEPDQRKCTLCQTMEDEVHFVVKCPRYQNERIELYNTVKGMCPNFISLPDKQKFYYLVTAEREIIKATAKFCHAAFERHKSCSQHAPVV